MKNKLAVWSLVSALITVVIIPVELFLLWLIWPGIILALISLVLGIVAIVSAISALRKRQNKGLSITGLILGSLTSILNLILVGSFILDLVKFNL